VGAPFWNCARFCAPSRSKSIDIGITHELVLVTRNPLRLLLLISTEGYRVIPRQNAENQLLTGGL
jgi:hypothetical protein